MNDPFANKAFNKPNDKVENPMVDLDLPLVPMNEGKGLDLTVASKKDSFFKKGDAGINADDAAGPKDAPTMPGGNPGIKGFKASPGSQMQYAVEGNQEYAGVAVLGKVVHASGDKKVNKIYG
jgi:hypothetical protein